MNDDTDPKESRVAHTAVPAVTNRGKPSSAIRITCRVREADDGRDAASPEKESLPLHPVEPGNVPRISRLMALALRFERLVRTGEVRDYADLARLGHVSRARITQIMNLLHLAPDIQEDILFLPRTLRGRDAITEHQIRPIVAAPKWAKQRRMWKALKTQLPVQHSNLLS